MDFARYRNVLSDTAMREAIARIKGVSFRTILDEQGDTATFIGFFLPDAEKAKAVNKVLAAGAAGAIAFGSNTWHFYPKWEHLLAGSTLARSGWPFSGPDGKRRVAEAMRGLNYTVIGVGDSYNDISMLTAADHGILYRPPDNVRREPPAFPVAIDFITLRTMIAALLGNGG